MDQNRSFLVRNSWIAIGSVFEPAWLAHHGLLQQQVVKPFRDMVEPSRTVTCLRWHWTALYQHWMMLQICLFHCPPISHGNSASLLSHTKMRWPVCPIPCTTGAGPALGLVQAPYTIRQDQNIPTQKEVLLLKGKDLLNLCLLGTEGVLSWGCFWRSLTKVVLEPKDFVHVTTSALRTGFCSHIPHFVF